MIKEVEIEMVEADEGPPVACISAFWGETGDRGTWLASISGKATRRQREFIRARFHEWTHYYPVAALVAGRAYEAACDVVKSNGDRYGDRHFFIVRALTAVAVVVETYKTPSPALRAAQAVAEFPETEAREFDERWLRQQGHDAATEGLPITACPYEEAPDLRALCWKEGWWAACLPEQRQQAG